MNWSSVLRGKFFLLSLTILLCGCGVASSDYDSRFLEKYLLDGERAVQEYDGERAERMFRQALSHAEKLGNVDWRVALAEGRLGKVLLMDRKQVEAKQVLTSAANHFRSAKPPQGASANLFAKEKGENDSLLGLLLLDQGNIGAARPYLDEATVLLKPFWASAADERERDTLCGIGYARALYGLGRVREQSGERDLASHLYEEALAVIDGERIPVPFRGDLTETYAKLLSASGQTDKAEKVRSAQEKYVRFNPGGPQAVARDAWHELVEKAGNAARKNDYQEADRLFGQALSQTDIYAKDGSDALETICGWAVLKQGLADTAGADRLLNQADAIALKLGGENSPEMDNAMFARERVLKLRGNWDELEALALKQLALREKLRGKNNFHVGEMLLRLADYRFHKKKWEEGEADLRRAIGIFQQNPQRNYRALKEAYDKLIPVLEREEKLDDVRKMKFDRAVIEKNAIRWEAEKHEH